MLRLMSHICLKTKRCEAGSSGSFWLVPTSFETCSVGYWNISLVNVVVVWGENIGVYCRVITLFTLSCVSGCWWRSISNIYSCDFDAAEAMFTFNSLTSGISSTAVVWWLYCMIFFFWIWCTGYEFMWQFNSFNALDNSLQFETYLPGWRGKVLILRLHCIPNHMFIDWFTLYRPGFV